MSEEEAEDRFEWEVRDESVPFVIHALAGSCAGLAEHCSMFPIDTIKTRMQASQVNIGMREAARSVLQERGVAGFYRGAAAIGAGCIPAHVGLFGTYEYTMNRWVDRQSSQHQPLQSAACGATAQVVHDGVLTPHDVVKQRLQLGRHFGVMDCARAVYQTEGVSAFYRSLPATLAMNVPYTGMFVATNESLKVFMGISGIRADFDHAPTYFLCAGMSGAVAAAVTAPMDIVKTRLQTLEEPCPKQAFNSSSSCQAQCSPVTMQRACLRSISSGIYAREGASGFFRGVVPRVTLATPATAICWGTYECVRSALIETSLNPPTRTRSRPDTGMDRPAVLPDVLGNAKRSLAVL